jgi:hypothetical protein
MPSPIDHVSRDQCLPVAGVARFRINGVHREGRSVSFARPKSRTFTMPSTRIMIFSGLMSR